MRNTWDQFVTSHPKGSAFHTSNMVKVFQAAKGHSVLPLAAVDSCGAIIALLVAVKVQTLPAPFGRVSSRSILYGEPLCNEDPMSVAALAELVEIHDRRMSNQVLFTEVRPLCGPGPERQALERNDYEFQEYLNYIIDLSPPIESLWKNMRKSARRGVRQCERRGFHIRELNSREDVEQLYAILKTTYHRAQVPLADSSLFEAAFEELHPRGMLRLIATYEGDTPLAMDSLLTFNGRTFAWYGGLERITGISPFDYLQWYEIVWARCHGCEIYDFGGAGWPNEPYGVRDYKAKFGGELVSFGRYRKIHRPLTKRLAERAYQLGRAILAPK